MRKLLLTATVLLMSATAHADPSLRVAENDAAPAAAAVSAAEPAKATEPAPVAETPVQIAKPKPHAERRESDEHKARRIAAKYGIYW